MTKLYVGNLPFATPEDAVRERFSPHGTIEKLSPITDRETGRPPGRPHYSRGEELLIDFRRRLELDEEERVERRRVDIAAQTLEPNVPSARIRAWEKVHALRMPSSPGHRVLSLIAAATQLSLADVHEEQRIRSERAAVI
jgi:hypothetical protein